MEAILDSFKGKNKYIAFLVFLFVFGAILGYFAFLFNPEMVVRNMEKLLGNILKISRAIGRENKLYIIGMIFRNNIKALLFMMFGGILLGLAPILGILFNGFAVGIVYALNFHQGRSLAFFLAAMLPHGILELPAVILAAAFGLKTGAELVFPGKSSRLELLKKNLKESVLALGILVPVLFVAAVIEASITPYFARKFF
ncbi:MAG: stage sporulation protein [Tepidanaerobacteraceae bacterium]|nr:stage sporulation protein [Tepidanaerobacteraceae bacterium]